MEDFLKQHHVTFEKIGETVDKGDCEIQGIRLADMEQLKQLWQTRLED